MAKAYLGKISALVTANTSDFNSKLNASANELRSFAKSMQTSLTRAQSEATSALRGIYTESQKVSRALQAVATQRLSFKGFDTAAVGSIRQAVDQFKALQQAAVAVNEPLSRAARAVEKLSAPVQMGFEPAMKSAQKSAEYLNSALTRGGIIGEKSFERIERRALAAAQAADRLAEAAQMASAGPRGTELAFAAPRVRDSLAASADVRQRAAAAPASVLEGGRVANDVQKLVAIDNLIQKRRAEVESGTILNIDTTRAQASLESLLQIAARVRAQVSAAIGGGGADAETASLINRARAQRDYYEESERLANQAASDAAAPLIARARAERDFYEESRRLAGQAAADAAAPLIARAQAEREFYEESERLRRQAAADSSATADREVAPLINRARAQRDSQIDFGLDLDAPKRQIEVLRGSIVSLKGQLDTLPAGIRAQFVPAILAAQQNLEALAAAPAATAEQIDAASAAVARLQSAAANASKFTTSLSQSFDDTRVRVFSARLEALRSILINVGATASTDAARRFEVLRQAILEAAASGDFTAVIGNLNKLEKEAIDAAAAFSGLSSKNIAANLQRAGDVGRAGFDKFSLALNQAAFAIDDFFSATGGLEFKLRAVSNNITQLGFIIGGTTGLFVTLGAVVAGQVAVGIAKFVFETDKADAALKALNDALEANQRNVEQLADSYKRLANEIAKATLSPRDNVRRERAQRREEIDRQRRATEEEAFASLSPEVARVRGERELLKKRQQESNDVQERVRIAKQIRDNLKQERELLDNRGVDAARNLLTQSADRQLAAQEVRLKRARARRALGSPEQAGENVEQLEQVVARAREQAAAARRARVPSANTSAGTRSQLDSLRGSLAGAEQARADLVRALPRQTPGSRVTRLEELDQTISELKDRIEVVSAVLGGQLASELIDGQGRIQDSLNATAESLSSVDIATAIGEQRDKLARELTAIADELATISDPARADALRQQQEEIAKNAAALQSSAKSVEQFAAVVDRVAKQLADTVTQEVQGRADQARRGLNAARGAELAGTSGLPAFRRGRAGVDQRRAVEQADEDRRRADAELRRARGAQQAFERRRRRSLRRFENAASDGNLGEEAQSMIRQRDAAQAVLDSETSTAAEQRRAADLLAEANARLEQLFQDSTLGQALAKFADQLDIAAQRAVEVDRQIEQQRQSVERGRELSMQPGQREGEELQQQIQDIRNYFDQAVEESTGLPDDVRQLRAQMNEAITRAQEEMARQVAPTIMGAADARMNAVLQGPSRRELTTADIRTDAGSRELSRLLRGDDDAKNADLANLQREANRLLQVIAGKNNPVA
jgi:hypothetical protein